MSEEKKHHSSGKRGKAGKKPDPVLVPELIEVPREELEELRRRAETDSESREKMLRTLAEMENLRKRLDRERQDYIAYANQELLGEFVPVLDNFHRALGSISRTEATASLFDGVVMISRQLEDVLKKQGLEEVEAEGMPFDPHFHEAVQVENTDRCSEDTILEVIRKGYLLRGRLLRPAEVKVSCLNPEKSPTNSDE